MNSTSSLEAEDRDRDREQACNECRRRKARCDKLLPECGPCKRNRRHCLYERHARTPLTRKYLTQVEEQLRRSQIQAARAEQRVQAAEARVRQLEAGRSNGAQELHQQHDAAAAAATADDSPIGVTLEAPPSGPADFSWDEQSQDTTPVDIDSASTHPHTSPVEDERVADGMASLTVDESEAGYLGVASGAAMLRLLLPGAHHSSRKAPPVSSASTALPENEHWLYTPFWDSLDLGAIDLDAAINGYFSLYHNSYPLVEEHTFRAQYAQVIPRPSGRSWHALAFMVTAIGHFTTAKSSDDTDRRLFMAAKSNISIESLEIGNITLVQTLTLMSNYLQKRNKPNSGYNYLGLALHMALGLGLHKEFDHWDISPLNMEIRRRVWWSMFVFNIGAAVTFGRPLAWPNKNVEVHLPINVSDRALTNLSRTAPNEADHVTTFSAVIMQSRFHILTNDIYTKVISMPFPAAAELVRLDNLMIAKWELSVPEWYRRDANIPPQFATGHAIMWWRLSNFKIIMYRPYVIRYVLQARSRAVEDAMPPAVQEAYARCLHEAEESIKTISSFWAKSSPSRMSAWYALYFLFQASLIPCVCLRNKPTSPASEAWRAQINQTMSTMQQLLPLNPSAQDCLNVLQRLCGPFLQPQPAVEDAHMLANPDGDMVEHPTDESPHTQINNVYSMMWPGASEAEIDVLTQGGLWADFLPTIDNLGEPNPSESNAFTETQFPWV